MFNFKFYSLTANTGFGLRCDSNMVFKNAEEEKEIRNMVACAFAGETVRIPDSAFSMTGIKAGKDFLFRIAPDKWDVPKEIEQFFPYGKFHIHYLLGTADKYSEKPLSFAKRALDIYRRNPEMAFELADISKMKVPKDPYSVDVLNYPITLFGGKEWFLSGLSSHYSLVLPCAAIGMLLE